MRLRAEQLPAHLARATAPVYVVSGDVPLLVEESCSAIRERLRATGCEERLALAADAGFDWNAFQHSANSLSLFGARRLIEVRMAGPRPGEGGAQALQAYAENPPPGDVLLVIAPKIDKGVQAAKWFKALDRVGVVVQVWPLDAGQMPAWIERRMRAKGLHPSREAAALLAERVEGNLLAGAQEIEKLVLLHGPAAIDAAAVMQAVADSARFNVFDLVDSAVAGDAARTARILDGLRAEGVEPPLVLWALAREIRASAGTTGERRGGGPAGRKPGKHGAQAAPERSDGGRRRLWLRRAARVDRVIKGAAPGNAWDELLQLGLLVAGKPLWKTGCG